VTDASARDSVTLQINVAPIDLPHAEATLRHQLRRWGEQVAAVIFTLDLARSPGPRGLAFEQRRPAMEQLMERLAAASPGHRVLPVDYGQEAIERVASMFFAGVSPPAKDCYGAPFYGYFHGLSHVQTRYVLHTDCDILFGGGSQAWIAEAIELLDARTDGLFVAPLPGAPMANARISQRRRHGHQQLFGSEAVLERHDPLTYRLRHASSRVFFADLDRLRAAAPFSILDAPPWSRGTNLATTPFLPAETTLSKAMNDGSWLRFDYLGTGAGMWWLHPSQRGPGFAANLPSVITALELDAVPDYQRGVGELSTAWLNAVGPERVEQPRIARDVARAVVRATGLLRVRDAIWRSYWRRSHELGRGEYSQKRAEGDRPR
jgi:hypothetical protein